MTRLPSWPMAPVTEGNTDTSRLFSSAWAFPRRDFVSFGSLVSTALADLEAKIDVHFSKVSDMAYPRLFPLRAHVEKHYALYAKLKGFLLHLRHWHTCPVGD